MDHLDFAEEPEEPPEEPLAEVVQERPRALTAAEREVQQHMTKDPLRAAEVPVTQEDTVAPSAPTVSEADFVVHEGFIEQGNDLLVETMTPAEAASRCAALPGCCGFTFSGGRTASPVAIYFKGVFNVQGAGWTSYQYLPRAPASAAAATAGGTDPLTSVGSFLEAAKNEPAPAPAPAPAPRPAPAPAPALAPAPAPAPSPEPQPVDPADLMVEFNGIAHGDQVGTFRANNEHMGWLGDDGTVVAHPLSAVRRGEWLAGKFRILIEMEDGETQVVPLDDFADADYDAMNYHFEQCCGVTINKHEV